MENKGTKKTILFSSISEIIEANKQELASLKHLLPIHKIDFFNLSESGFSRFYSDEIVPKIFQLFTEMKSLKKEPFYWIMLFMFRVLPIFFFSFISYLIIKDTFFTPGKIKTFSSIIMPFILIPVMFFFWIWLPYKIFDFSCKKPSKHAIKGILFDSLGIDYIRNSDPKSFFWSRFCQVAHSLPLRFSAAIAEEFLCFNYKDKMLSFAEYEGLVSSTRIKICSYTTDKKFVGETLVACDEKVIPALFRLKEKVILEDPTFNKKFIVLSSDQVEARYLLTSAFMERLLKFQEKYNCLVDVLFSNRSAPDLGNVFISITSNRDFFNIPSDWFKDMPPEPIYKIIQEVKELAEIFDALKLDQDIGM